MNIPRDKRPLGFVPVRDDAARGASSQEWTATVLMQKKPKSSCLLIEMMPGTMLEEAFVPQEHRTAEKQG